MDRLIDSLLVLVIGVLVVFFGLVLLIGLVKIITMLTTDRKQKATEAPAAPASVQAPAPVQAAAVPASQDDTLIAVITAAVACAMEEGTAFTVRRVRRISNAPAWQKAGREEQIYSRF